MARAYLCNGSIEVQWSERCIPEIRNFELKIISIAGARAYLCNGSIEVESKAARARGAATLSDVCVWMLILLHYCVWQRCLASWRSKIQQSERSRRMISARSYWKRILGLFIYFKVGDVMPLPSWRSKFQQSERSLRMISARARIGSKYLNLLFIS